MRKLRGAAGPGSQRPVLRPGWLLGAFCCALASCSSILGIDEAVCDPTFDPDCRPPAADDTEPEPTDGEDSDGAGATEATDDEATETEATDDPTDTVSDDPESDAAADTDGVPDSVDAGITDDTDVSDGDPPQDVDGTDVDDDPGLDAGIDPPDTGAGDPRRAACDEYCAAVTAHCTGDDVQYPSEQACLEVCLQLMRSESEVPPGDSNTIECRLAAAQDAQIGEADLNCQLASMVGGEFCGAPCDVYCSMVEASCIELAPESFDCAAECATLPSTGEPFTPSIESGNFIECRFNHLRLAVTSRNPALHCPHVLGAAPCR